MTPGQPGSRPVPARKGVERLVRGYLWGNAVAAAMILAFAFLFGVAWHKPVTGLVFVGIGIVALAVSIPAIRRMEADMMARVEAAERGESPK